MATVRPMAAATAPMEATEAAEELIETEAARQLSRGRVRAWWQWALRSVSSHLGRVARR